ncbi:MAG: exodeoxyribonuclease III [Defluviitaleaceae bacterium]|nr:exodeoxyribonuclease III [Defluviitaleaceae bacterium]
MKIISWNVNGLRAAFHKGFADYIIKAKPNIVMLQEVKISVLPAEFTEFCRNQGFTISHNPAKKKGYSGTLCMYRKKPKKVTFDMNRAESELENDSFNGLNAEGRLITLEYPSFYIINTYTPNSQSSLSRNYFRCEWDEGFKDYIKTLQLQSDKPLIIGGDLNVVRGSADVFSKIAKLEDFEDFSEEKRDSFENLLIDCSLTDVFRHFYPTKEGAYTCWCNGLDRRAKNQGWRIDYFLASKDIISKIKKITIRNDVTGSDHCPLELEILPL